MGTKYIDDVHEAIATNGRPWSKRAAELYEKEGHWADYAAWESWIREKSGDECGWLDCIEPVEKATLYSTFCDVADGNHKKTEETCR